MNSKHHENVKGFYNIQERLYVSLGAFELLTTNNSKTKRITYELYATLIFLFSMIYTLSLSVSFIMLPSILDKIMKVFYMLGTLIGAIVKFLYLKLNSGLYRENGRFLHKEVFKPRNEAENEIFSRSLNRSTKIRNCYYSLAFSSVLYSYGLQQLIDLDELPALMYSPFDETNPAVFAMMKVYSFLAVGLLCFVHVSFDSWCISFMIFIQGQLEILKYRLERIGDNSQADSLINEELKTCLRLHSAVCEVVGKLERLMAFPVSLQIFCSVLVLCCNFYAISFTSYSEDSKTFVKFGLYQCVMLFQIFLICFVANEVTLASEKLSYSLYSSNWIKWNKVNRKLVLLTLLRLQSVIRINSINRCYHFDVAAFTSIVNTSYSYFALLKQMNG